MTETDFFAGGSCGLPEAVQRLVAHFELPGGRCRQLITDGLRSGQIGATVVGFQGERCQATVADFTDAGLDFGEDDNPAGLIPLPVLDQSEGDGGGFSLGVIRLVRPWLEVHLPDLDQYVRQVLGIPAAAAVNVEPSKILRDRGGRPPVHDWTLAAIQATARVYEHGLPASKNELARELADWFAANSTTPPDLRQVERFVAKIWDTLRRGPDAICQLPLSDGRGGKT